MAVCYGTQKTLVLDTCRVQGFTYNPDTELQYQIFDAPLSEVAILVLEDREQIILNYGEKSLTIDYDYGLWAFSGPNGETLEPEEFGDIVSWLTNYRTLCTGGVFVNEFLGEGQNVAVGGTGSEVVTFASSAQWFQIVNLDATNIIEVQIGTGANSLIHLVGPGKELVIDYRTFGFGTPLQFNEITLVNGNADAVSVIVNARSFT